MKTHFSSSFPLPESAIVTFAFKNHFYLGGPGTVFHADANIEQPVPTKISPDNFGERERKKIELLFPFILFYFIFFFLNADPSIPQDEKAWTAFLSTNNFCLSLMT
jgi:hypothetical protein